MEQPNLYEVAQRPLMTCFPQQSSFCYKETNTIGDLSEISENESSVDISAYIDPAQLNDEFLEDLLHNNNKPEKVKLAGADYGYPHVNSSEPRVNQQLYGCMANYTDASNSEPIYENYSVRGKRPVAIKREPGEDDDLCQSSVSPVFTNSLHRHPAQHITHLQYQIAHCAQTSMHIHPGHPTPPPTPVPSPHLQQGPVKTSERGRSKKHVDKNSSEYRLRRERNNVAVRKSRDKAKMRNAETQQKVLELAVDNERLRKKVEHLSRELDTLRGIFKQRPDGSFVSIDGQLRINEHMSSSDFGNGFK
ncbi:CCAAT/enhancer-binding protein alpha-like [Brienomyrus brachyistius]|uniref:CCAAT/enhancer-binding protein alpha-like n=1 Tax=Brienomyrus brachyistius TaxID=42636 RepID=UPI0020B413D8|nr:CCAAT/enhancer-binding protein alpha-like [Brienomyrus brachyistius]